jgi:hypothetical protein
MVHTCKAASHSDLTASWRIKSRQRKGGIQSKSLRLVDPTGKEWILSSVEKTPDKLLPEGVKGTFVVDWVDDEFNLASYILAGQVGLTGFYDTGRVWVRDEHSDKWHQGAGGGLYFAPAGLTCFQFLAGHSAEG